MSNVEMLSEVTRKYFEDWDDFDFRVPKETKDAIKKNIIAQEAKYSSLYETCAVLQGVSVEEFKEKYQKYAETIVSQLNPYIAIRSESGWRKSSFQKMLETGCFKSIFEVGNPDYGARPNELRSYLLQRAQIEHVAFGLSCSENEDIDKRPIYGYLLRGDLGVPRSGYDVTRFGNVFCKIRKDKAVQSGAIFMDFDKGTEVVSPYAKPHFTLLTDEQVCGSSTYRDAIRNPKIIEEYIMGSDILPSPRRVFRMAHLNQVSANDIESITICKNAKIMRDITQREVIGWRTVLKSVNYITNHIIEILKLYEKETGRTIPLNILEEDFIECG